MEANELESHEGTGGAEFALGVTLTPSTKQDVLPEFRSMRDAVVAWEAKRGDDGVLIIVNVVAPSEVHAIFDDLLAKVYAQGSPFGRLLRQRTLQVTYLDLEGNECDQYDVEPADSASDSGE